ncbi:sodium/potassium/calcium exchanger 4 isoform X2 [Bacillus rossius redtenbacheri]|uniref:sodium/potassium/calcium exchanger 4 isoform X2 n=1 Tax=Bacillus rossius redtenbacheri TaxID=93214 RepID=UPI002FDDFF1B
MTWLDDEQIFEVNCTPPAIDDFPRDLFSERQRQDGALALHVLGSLYLFVALAVVCDKYFVPAVEKICQALNMSNDVAGATFMAAATSAPELFVNVIGTFITEGDIGVGTIVGSAVFNILAVAACCGIGAGIVVPLDWWPLTRDCLAYGMTVALMICIIHDERVEWYEALILVLLYIVYIAVMYWDKPIQQFTRGRLGLTKEKEKNDPVENCTDGGEAGVQLPVSGRQQLQMQQNGRIKVSTDRMAQEDAADTESVNLLGVTSLFRWPQTEKAWKQAAWVLVWPIHLVFLVTIPDCEKPRFKRWFPLTFIMCIIWIASLSYVVAWMITIIGDTLKIPDSVMGITFLAAGTSVPEAVSSVIVAKQGTYATVYKVTARWASATPSAPTRSTSCCAWGCRGSSRRPSCPPPRDSTSWASTRAAWSTAPSRCCPRSCCCTPPSLATGSLWTARWATRACSCTAASSCSPRSSS